MWHTEHQWMLFSYFISIPPQVIYWTYGRLGEKESSNSAIHGGSQVGHSLWSKGWNRSLGFFRPSGDTAKSQKTTSYFLTDFSAMLWSLSSWSVNGSDEKSAYRDRCRGGWGSVFSSHQDVQVGSNGRPRDRAAARQHQGQDTTGGWMNLDKQRDKMGWKWWNKQK